jgi:hypothetical protein
MQLLDIGLLLLHLTLLIVSVALKDLLQLMNFLL